MDDGVGTVEYSKKFGCEVGLNDKIVLGEDHYLTSISGTFGKRWNLFGPVVVTSLCFYTTRTKYGPYGCKTGTPFSLPMEDGGIVGLHGRADDEGLQSIGVYVVPTGFLSTSRSECRMQHKVDKSMIMVVPREPGPWGGLGGKQWDDGVFPEIHELHLEYGDSAIHSLQIMYETKEGKRDWSHRHGGPGGTELIRSSGLYVEAIGVHMEYL
ncbi:Agglutinin [Morella rubra]|uniref:Agglutinin n=1 Tax=Morella rubra TaxID=262757 RepID=A0A6A1W5R4_9ROSI|nr:Agglutinin [Morella rubra]